MAAAAQLSKLTAGKDGKPLFGEIDNRGSSLFATLTYPDEVDASVAVNGAPTAIRLADHVVFVAIKNGMHNGNGYVYYRGEIANFAAPDGAHVKSLHTTISNFFKASVNGGRPAHATAPASRGA